MAAPEATPGQPEPRPGRPRTAIELIVELVREIISDWDRTLRFALLVSVVVLSVAAGLYGFAQIAADPSRWWKPALCAAGVYTVIQLRRLIQRHARKLSGRRH